jgi:hypothetical protein
MTEDNEIEKTYTAAGALFLGLIGLLFGSMLFAFPFMYFWNNVLIEVSTILKEINYWQSVSTIIFIFFIGRLFNFSGNK